MDKAFNSSAGQFGLTIGLVAVALLSLCNPAQAQTSYKYQITPYLFTTGVNGTIAERGRSASVDASFSDVLHHLDMAAMVYFDARFGKWRFLLDNLYTKVSNARSTPGPLFDSVNVRTKMWIVDPEVGYAILQKEDRELDVTAGARIWNLNNQLTFFRGGSQAEFDPGSRTIANPIVGTRYYSNLTPKIFIVGKADVGGFNADASTDWQVFASGGYKFNDTIVATLGYRYLSIDFSNSNTVFDIHLNGLVLGIGIRF
jgi:hypothetical protein